MLRTLTLLLFVCLAPTAIGQVSNERTIQFSFEKADWKDVIPWFAEQAGFSLQPISDWPESTFTLSDDQKYTPMEALDQLNYALRLRKPPYTIVRNRNQLILTEASEGLPEELIETVRPDQLDQRGAYEIVSCQFSLGDVLLIDVEEDLRGLLSQKYQQYSRSLIAANEFHARDTGANLRKVRDVIKKMTQRKATATATYIVKHYDPEEFMNIVRRLLGIEEGLYDRNDGSLVVSIDSSNNRMILKGTPTSIEDFKRVAATVDVPTSEQEVSLERSLLKKYPVLTDPEIAMQVIQTMLDGTDATVGQDESSGAIILRGRKEHHQIAEETIATLRGELGTTEIVRLQNASASSVLSAVQTLMNLSATTTAENPSGPKLLANTVQNYIIVRGTPAEIFEITQMIKQLDQAQQLDPDRVRTNTRIFKLPPAKRDDLLEGLEDYWPATGRQNRLRIIMPEDRKSSIDSINRFSTPTQPQPSARPDGSNTRPAGSNTRSEGANTRVEPTPRLHCPSDQRTSMSAWDGHQVGLSSALVNLFSTSFLAYCPQDDITSPSGPSTNSRDRYVPVAPRESVPGAPIMIKGTAFGIVIESDDLDALDDMESLLNQEIGEEGSDQGLTVYYLKYQQSTSIKAALDTMFGLDGGSGGGAGGDLLGGIIGNVAGGGAGDAIGSLLGGGTSSAGAVIKLEGTVQIADYPPLNLIYVSGATRSDLQTITDVIDTFDRPSPPQNPELIGQFYSIQVRYRDPEQVLTTIKNLMADYIAADASPQRGSEDGGGRRGNGSEQVARIVRSVTGGDEEGGGGAVAQELPKIRLDLDLGTDQILVTGPEFIYQQIKSLVLLIDTPIIDTPKTTHVLPSGSVTPSTLRIIQEQFGSKIVTVSEQVDAAAQNAAGAEARAQTGAQQSSQAGVSAAARERETQNRRAAQLLRTLRQNGGGQTDRRQQGGGQRGGGQRGQRGGGQRGGR